MPEGRCNCGAVQFVIDISLTDVYVCHCSICRRFTGANGIAVVIVPNDKIRFLTGRDHVVTWRKPDGDWQSSFCRNCGSALPGENTATNMFVPVGALSTGAEALKVAHHVWVGSKATWDIIGDSGEQHVERLVPVTGSQL
jgi:hypothetical protein